MKKLLPSLFSFIFIITFSFHLSGCFSNEEKEEQEQAAVKENTSPANETPVTHLQTIKEDRLGGCKADSVCFNLKYERKEGDKLMINIFTGGHTADILIYLNEVKGEPVMVFHALSPQIAEIGGELSALHDGHYIAHVRRNDLKTFIGIDIITIK